MILVTEFPLLAASKFPEVFQEKVTRGVIFMRARVSLALLSLSKNGGLLVVYEL